MLAGVVRRWYTDATAMVQPIPERYLVAERSAVRSRLMDPLFPAAVEYGVWDATHAEWTAHSLVAEDRVLVQRAADTLNEQEATQRHDRWRRTASR